MQATSFRRELQQRILTLLWSLWTELGVSGWERHHSAIGIDVEPLVLATPVLVSVDPRLRDESLDWCVRFGHLVSASRLRNLLARSTSDIRDAFGPYAATVTAHTHLRWPDASRPWPYRSTGKSHLADLRQPALVQLRLRALLGVSARAEVLRLFLAQPSATMAASDLVGEGAYVKRSLAEALESLKLAGVLEAINARNQIRYRLRTGPIGAAAFGELPIASPSWHSVFSVLLELLRYADGSEGVPRPVAAAEVAGVSRRIETELRILRVQGPPQGSGDDLPPVFDRWALDLAGSLASAACWSTSQQAALHGSGRPFP